MLVVDTNTHEGVKSTLCGLVIFHIGFVLFWIPLECYSDFGFLHQRSGLDNTRGEEDTTRISAGFIGENLSSGELNRTYCGIVNQVERTISLTIEGEVGFEQVGLALAILEDVEHYRVTTSIDRFAQAEGVTVEAPVANPFIALAIALGDDQT